MDYDPYERNLSPGPNRPRSRLSSEYSGASTTHPVEWQDDWIHREEEFRDTINALQNEQERIQKKTFTNWINSHVEQHRDKWVVKDLFTDLKDGRILLALIESITGDHLPCESFRNYTRAHYLSNVERALDYLRDRNIKLVNINSSDVVDGNETVILGLIWTIILNFQIDQDLAHLRENFLISPVPSGAQSASYDARSRSVSPSPTKKQRLTTGRGRFQAGASKAMLKWCQKEISDRYGIPILNLSSSWKDGMAFLGLVKVLDPNLVNLNDFRSASPAQRMNAAFSLAQERLGIPKFLDVADIDVERPDERSIMTYIAQFIKRFPEAKRNRQKMVMENLPDVEAIEASERAEYERIRDWCLDVLTVLKCLELTDERPFEAYEEYKRFQQNFRTNINAYARLKEQFEEGRTLHLTEANVLELDSLFSRVISEKLIWHRHLFEILQGQEQNLCIRYARIESELDQRVLLPPQKVTHYSKSNLEFRVQKHEDVFGALTNLREEVDQYLSQKYPTEVFAWHDLAGDVQSMIVELERRLLSERCKLIIKRQLAIVDEWEKRVARWQEFLKPPGHNVERLTYEFELHVVEEKIFDKFLDFSKQLQLCLERLHDDAPADKQQRAAFLSTAVNSNRRWKRIGEDLHSIREEIRRWQTTSATQKRNRGDRSELFSPPMVSLSATSPTSPPPLYLKSERWSLYLQMVAAFNRWLDRMERDFESIDREDVNRVEYQQGLQRFRALCAEVVQHKSDGQQIIDTFYTCSTDLPPTVIAEETRKINRLIRRYDALIPSLEVIRSEVEHSAVHSHQVVDTRKETVQLVPDRPESVQDQQQLRVRTPAGGALSPAISVATSGYATPEFENVLLRRSEPTTPSDSFNRSPPFAYGISSQSSMNEGSPVEPVFVRDIDIVEDPDTRRRPVSPSPEDVGGRKSAHSGDRLLVRDVPVREESRSSAATPVKSKVMFASSTSRNVDTSESEQDSSDQKQKMSSSKNRVKMETSTSQSSTTSGITHRIGIAPVSFEKGKIQSLRAAFEAPKNLPEESAPKLTSTKKYGIFDTLRRKSRSTSSSSSDSDAAGEKVDRERRKKSKKSPRHSTSETETATFVRSSTSRDDSPPRQRPLGVLQNSSISDRTIEEAVLAEPSSSHSTDTSLESKKKYIRNVKTTTLVTSTETKTVKTVVLEKSPSKERLFEGAGASRVVGKLSTPTVFTSETSRSSVRSDPEDPSATRVSSEDSSGTRVGKLVKPALFSETSSPMPASSPRRVETESSGKEESSSSFNPFKKTKKNTRTEYEETTQTVKRTVLSPVPTEKSLLEKEVSTPTVVTDVEAVSRRIDFDEGIQPQSLRSSGESASGYQQKVLIVPYGSSRTTDVPLESSQKANRMIDLFEKGKDNPTLFVEQIPESAPARDLTSSAERSASHVSSTTPMKLFVEREETYVYDEPIPLTQPVSQRIQSFEDIFAPLNTDVTKFDTTERRPGNFNTFATEQFVRDAQVPPAEIEREQETVVRSSATSSSGEEEKVKKKSGGLFGGIFKSKKVAPAPQTATVVQEVVTERSPEPAVPHHTGVTDSSIEDETVKTFREPLPEDVRDFLGSPSEESRGPPLGSSEHFHDIVRRFSHGEDQRDVVAAASPPIAQVHIPAVYRRETSTDSETAVKTRKRTDISHFVPLSDRGFESRLFDKHSGSGAVKSSVETFAETTPVHGRIKLFETIQGVEYAKSAETRDDELVSMSRASRDSKEKSAEKKSAFAQWAARDEQTSMVTRTEEKAATPKKSTNILESMGMKKKDPVSESLSQTVKVDTVAPPALPLSLAPRERSTEEIFHQTSFGDNITPPLDHARERNVQFSTNTTSTPVVEVQKSDLSSDSEERTVMEEVAVVQSSPESNYRRVYPLEGQSHLREEPSETQLEHFSDTEEMSSPVIGRRDWENREVLEQTVVERDVLRSGQAVNTPVVRVGKSAEETHVESISEQVATPDEDLSLARALSSTRDDFITSSEPFDGSPVMDESVRTEHFHEVPAHSTETYVRDVPPSSTEDLELEHIADELTFVTEGLAHVTERFYPEQPATHPNEETLFESVTVQKDRPEDASMLVRDVTERVSVPKSEDRRSFAESVSGSSDEGTTKRHRGQTVEHHVGQSDATVAFHESRTQSISPVRSPKTQKVKYQSIHSETLPSSSFSTKSEEVFREEIPRDRRVESPTQETFQETVVRSTTPDFEKPEGKLRKSRSKEQFSETLVRSASSELSENVRSSDESTGEAVSRGQLPVIRHRVADKDSSIEALSQTMTSVVSKIDHDEVSRSRTVEPTTTREELRESVALNESEIEPVPHHHFGLSDRRIETFATTEEPEEIRDFPTQSIREKVTFLRDADVSARPKRTEEFSTEHVVRSRSKSPSDDLSETRKRKEVFVDTTKIPTEFGNFEEVVRAKSPPLSGATTEYHEETVVSTTSTPTTSHPNPDFQKIETVTRVRAESPPPPYENHHSSSVIVESSSPVTTETITFVRPSPVEHHVRTTDRDVAEKVSEIPNREKFEEIVTETSAVRPAEEFDSATFVRTSSPEHHFRTSDRDIAEHITQIPAREVTVENLEESITKTKTAKPEKLTVGHVTSSVVPVLLEPIRSEEKSVFEIRERPQPVRDISSTSDLTISEFVESNRRDSATLDEGVSESYVAQEGHRAESETFVRDGQRSPENMEEILDERVSKVKLDADQLRTPEMEEVIRNRPGTVEHHVGLPDRELEMFTSDSRPALVTNLSETDLAPKRRSSAQILETEVTESGAEASQQYPWQATTTVAPSTVVHVEETVVQQSTPNVAPPVAPRPTSTLSPSTVEIESSKISTTNVRKASSSSSDSEKKSTSTSVVSENISKKEKKKSGFLGLFSSKDKKEKKEKPTPTTVTSVTSSTSTDRKPLPTSLVSSRTIVKEELEGAPKHEQKGVAGVGFRRISGDEFVSTSTTTVHTPAQSRERVHQTDTVAELIHGPRPETVVRSAESVISSETPEEIRTTQPEPLSEEKLEETVAQSTLSDRERVDVPVVHHTGIRDDHIEAWVAKNRPIPEVETIVSETTTEVRDLAPVVAVSETDSAHSSRSTKALPSFISFEKSTTVASKRPKKTSTGSRKSTPSPAPSTGSVEQEFSSRRARSKSPGSLRVGQEYSERVERSVSPLASGSVKHKEERVEYVRVPSRQGDRTRSETLEEDVLYTSRPSSRKEKFEAVTVVRTPGNSELEQEEEVLQRTDSPVLEHRSVLTPEPTRDVEFLTHRETITRNRSAQSLGSEELDTIVESERPAPIFHHLGSSDRDVEAIHVRDLVESSNRTEIAAPVESLRETVSVSEKSDSEKIQDEILREKSLEEIPLDRPLAVEHRVGLKDAFVEPFPERLRQTDVQPETQLHENSEHLYLKLHESSPQTEQLSTQTPAPVVEEFSEVVRTTDIDDAPSKKPAVETLVSEESHLSKEAQKASKISSSSSSSFESATTTAVLPMEESTTKKQKTKKGSIFGFLKSGSKKSSSSTTSSTVTTTVHSTPEQVTQVREVSQVEEPSSITMVKHSEPEVEVSNVGHAHFESPPEEPEMAPRERPLPVRHSVGLSDAAILSLVPIKATQEEVSEELRDRPEESTVIVSQETVVTTSPIPDKPVVKPRLTKKVSVPQLTEGVTETVVVEDVEPRIRHEGVVHRGHVSDDYIEGFERYRTVSAVEETPVVESLAESVVVEKTEETAKAKEPHSTVVKDEVRPTEIRKTETVVHQVEVESPPEVSTVESSAIKSETSTSKSKKSKSGGLFGMFKRRGSKDAKEVVSETSVHQSSVEDEPVTASATNQERVVEEQQKIVSREIHPEETIIHEASTHTNKPNLEILEETITEQTEVEAVPRDRPLPVIHHVSNGDADVEEIAKRQRIVTTSPETFVRESELSRVESQRVESHLENETSRVESLRKNESPRVESPRVESPRVESLSETVVSATQPEEQRTTEKLRKTVSFDKSPTEVVREGLDESVSEVSEEKVKNETVSTTKKSEKPKSKGLFGIFKSGTKAAAEEKTSKNLTEINSNLQSQSETVVKTVAEEEKTVSPVQVPLQEEEVLSPRERPPTVVHRVGISDDYLSEFISHKSMQEPDTSENLSESVVTVTTPQITHPVEQNRSVVKLVEAENVAENSEKKMKKFDDELERVSVTRIHVPPVVSRTEVVEIEEKEPTVVFGVKDVPKLTKEVLVVQEGPAVVSARSVPAGPPEEFVTTREIVTSTTSHAAEKDKKPKGSGILKNRGSSALPVVKQSSATVMVRSPSPDEILHPRERPDDVRHRTGPSDLLVTDQLEILQLEREQDLREQALRETVTVRKAGRVEVTSSSSSESESESEEEIVTVRRTRPAVTAVTSTSSEEEFQRTQSDRVQSQVPVRRPSPVVEYSEVVLEQNVKSPTVYDESALVRPAVVSEVTQVARSRPEEVFHHVGMSDVDNEQFAMATQGWEEVPVNQHKTLERLVTSSSSSKRPVMTTYKIDAGSDVEIEKEDLSESVKQTQLPAKTVVKEKAKLTGSPLDAARYRAPEAAIILNSEETTRVRHVRPDNETATIVSSTTEPIKTRHESETAHTIIRQAEAVDYTEEPKKPKKLRQSRRSSQSLSSSSSNSSIEGDVVKTTKRKAPKVPATKAASESTTIITREEYAKKTPVSQTVSDTLVRDVQPEPTYQRAVSPSSTITSETVTASVSRTGSRSKTPDSVAGKKKHSVMRTVKQKVRGGTPGPSSREGEYSYEDVIYWKTAKAKSPEPVGRTATTIETSSRAAHTVLPVVRSATLGYDTSVHEGGESVARTTREVTPSTETIVRESETSRKIEKPILHQEPAEKSGKVKTLVKKTRSGQSSSSSSSKEDVDEISSVTLTKAKLTSPTPEPRDEVQMVVAEMKSKKTPPANVTVHEEYHDVTPANQRDVTVKSQQETLRTEVRHEDLERQSRVPEVVVHSHLRTPYMMTTHEVTTVHAAHHAPREYTETIVQDPTEFSDERITTHQVKSSSTSKMTSLRTRLASGSSTSSTETEDEEGGKVRRKRRKVKTQPRVSEELQERISVRREGVPAEEPHRVVGHRDSETGLALIERTSTEQLPSYISFGTVEPDSLQSPTTEMLTRDIYRSEERHRPTDVTLRHHSGPKDEAIESIQILQTVRRVEELHHHSGPKDESIESIQISLRTLHGQNPDGSTSEFLAEDITVVSAPSQEHAHRAILDSLSTRKTGSATTQVASLTSESVVRSTETGNETRETTTREQPLTTREQSSSLGSRPTSPLSESSLHEFDVESEKFRTASPEGRISRTMVATNSGTRSTSRLSSSAGAERLEEHVDVYRVKFSKELEAQRPKTPNVYVGHEDLTMRTVSSQGGEVSRTATSSTTGSPAPLALPYPEVLRAERSPRPEDESIYAVANTHPERSGISKPLRKEVFTEEGLSVASPTKTTQEKSSSSTANSEQIKRRVLSTRDSVETSLVVEDFRRAALASPDVGDLEYWTTSGGSSDNLDDTVVSHSHDNRRSHVSDTPTYESIPPREKPARVGKKKVATEGATVVRRQPEGHEEHEERVEIYSDIEETRRALQQVRPVGLNQDDQQQRRVSPNQTRKIEVVTSPVSIIQTRDYDRTDTVPTYAKIQKKKKETLEEDVFYWKIMNRKKKRAYSAERIRASSPENNLTNDEMAVLARSINSLTDAKNSRKSRKSEIVTKTRSSKGRSSSSVAGVQSPGFDDSGAFSAPENRENRENRESRENYNVDLRLTSTLDSGSASNSSSLGRRTNISEKSPFSKEKRRFLVPIATPTMSFSPSSNENLFSERDSSPYDTERSGSSTPLGKGRASNIRKNLIAAVEFETTVRSASDDVDMRYRAAMREPLPDKHSCLPAYNSLYFVVHDQLEELDSLVLDPECQYIDQDILQSERQRFTALLDGLVRINKDLDRLDDLYRAMINVEPEASLWETESRQRELNQLYMDQLGHLKWILRRIKHLENLLDQYRKKRLHFKVRLLEELTYFRTHENMSEDDQRERVNGLLEEVLQLRSATYNMFVRSTPEFAERLEEELHEILMLLRTELRGSIIQLLLTGKYSVEFDATQQRLILSSEEITSEIPATTSRMSNPTVWSVLRRALPMQALALILLGFASLIPMTDDEFSCVFSNYFASSFNPALKFSGPPPI